MIYRLRIYSGHRYLYPNAYLGYDLNISDFHLRITNIILNSPLCCAQKPYLIDVPNYLLSNTSTLSLHFRECQFEQELDYNHTKRQLNYRRRKEDMKKKLSRLEKLHKIRSAEEKTGDQDEREEGAGGAAQQQVRIS